MGKVKILLACTFTVVLSTSFIHAAMIQLGCNSGQNISYGYARSIDNSSRTLYQTYGECYDANARVAVYVKDKAGNIVQGKDVTSGHPTSAMWKVSTPTTHSHWTASALIQ